MASTKISFTPSGAGNLNKWTISLWLKRAKIGVEQVIASCYENSNYQTQIKFETDDQLYFNDEQNGNTNGRIVSNAKYRDTNAWYHMVFIWDKDNSTSGDKLRMYVNGERITSFSDTGNAPSASSTWNVNGQAMQFGAKVTSDYFNGVMSHIHFCDGYSYEPTEFGETDSTTGEWKIKTSPSVSYGTNGYFWLKDNVATTDNSPNSNTFTASGTLTKTEDCPSNVFNNFNNLIPVPSSSYSNGNTKAVDGAGAHKAFYGSLGFSSGKYYWEAKAVGGSKYTIGLSDVENYINYTQVTSTNVIVGESSNSYGSGDAIGWYYNDINKNGSNIASGIHTIVTNDIMMVAVDADAGKIYYGLNGTWRVANSTTFNASSNDTTFTTGKTYTPAFSAESCGWEVNFGNGYFGTTAVSSAGTNASGNGIFEYNVPTGYTALSTKGLNL